MTTPTACLTQEERDQLTQLLRNSEAEFLQLISPLSEAQWTEPSSNGWSVQQTAEHLVLGERAMLGKVEEALANPENPAWQEQDERKAKFLGRVVPNRALKATAPPPLAPHNNWTLEHTISRFKQGRSRTLKLVMELEEPVKAHCSEHPFPAFNTLNAYHWLLYIPLHNVRHNQQIAQALQLASQSEIMP